MTMAVTRTSNQNESEAGGGPKMIVIKACLQFWGMIFFQFFFFFRNDLMGEILDGNGERAYIHLALCWYAWSGLHLFLLM